MQVIIRPLTDPWFNLAAEEFLLKSVEEDTFMVWRNNDAVVIGKHQNTIREINPIFVFEKKIPVIRRISGGGTVYHDPGNLNFTFISTNVKGDLVDFKRYILPVIEVLKSFGIPAVMTGRNNIAAGGMKISGNAEHIYRDRVLHHGTILVSSPLSRLNSAIRPTRARVDDRAINSVRSRVTKLDSLSDSPIEMQQLIDALQGHLAAGATVRELTTEEVTAINELAESKYKTWKWNFGYSPPYTYQTILVTPQNRYEVTLSVRNGLIRECKIDAGKSPEFSPDKLSEVLTGSPHSPFELIPQIRKWQKENSVPLSDDDLLKLVF
ncbi:MAG: lipoate--protein ligase [Bacteroidales bacterium]